MDTNALLNKRGTFLLLLLLLYVYQDMLIKFGLALLYTPSRLHNHLRRLTLDLSCYCERNLPRKWDIRFGIGLSSLFCISVRHPSLPPLFFSPMSQLLPQLVLLLVKRAISRPLRWWWRRVFLRLWLMKSLVICWYLIEASVWLMTDSWFALSLDHIVRLFHFSCRSPYRHDSVPCLLDVCP